MRDRVSGAIAIPKASWGCAPALPNQIQVVFLETCEILRCNCSPGTVARYLFSDKASQGGAVLFAPPRKAVAFLTTLSVCQKHGTGISLPAARNLQLISKLFFRIMFSNCFFNHRIRQATHLQPSDNWTEKE